MPKIPFLQPLILTVLVAAGADLALVHATDGQTPGPQAPPFTAPVRRPQTHTPAIVPSLPENADRIRPMTLDVRIETASRSGPRVLERRTISRTSTRIHVRGEGSEWLFQRNPVDPRRLNGQLVHHAKRLIVQHEESDLRNIVGLNGWADVLMLGIDETALRRLTATARSRTSAGIRFQELRAATPGTGLVEVWWSDDQAMPSAFTLRRDEGATSLKVTRVRAEVDESLLLDPALRFPAYRVIDVAEWLEGR
jgi:hypothetical protein